MARRFPPPWSAELQPNYYVVRDANKQQLAYVYYENEPGGRSAAKLLTKDEARRIAAKSPNCRSFFASPDPCQPPRMTAASATCDNGRPTNLPTVRRTSDRG